MPPVDLDALFGDGADLGQGVVAKAQLRFRVHPPRHPAARDVLDRVVAAYDERLGMIVDEIASVIRHTDHARTGDQALVLGLGSTVAKATVPHTPFRPGSRGGTWYRDAKGNVRYGVPPEGKFTGNAGDQPPPNDATPMPHLDHLRPGAFMGGHGNDQELVGFLSEHGHAYGFSEGELRFLSTWYGTGEEGGELFDAFLDCAGITRDDVKNGVTNLRFGAQQLTYEEAVFEFFAAQEVLFMGEDPDGDEAAKSETKPKPKSKAKKKPRAEDPQSAEWHRVLNEEIKPLLDSAFARYEAAKDDPDVQEQFSGESDRQRRRFYAAARRAVKDTKPVADAVVSAPDPRERFATVAAGMRALGLIASSSRVDRAAYIHGRPHLRDAVMIDGRLLGDGPDNPLLGDKDKLSTLPASQLMLVYAAAELHRRWDPYSRSFSTESQADAGSGELGETVLAAISSKGPDWADAAGVVSERLEGLVDLLVSELNRVNAREGTPAKHGPAKRSR